MQIVLPEPAAEELARLAAAAGRAPATLAAELVREAIARAAEQGAPRRAPRTRVLAGRDDPKPPWLPPAPASRAWRARMWGSIVTLRMRYPDALGRLHEGWWENEAQLETICALAVWREQIDAGCSDPREELAFQAQLLDYGAHLHRQPGGRPTWQPGAPPLDWADR